MVCTILLENHPNNYTVPRTAYADQSSASCLSDFREICAETFLAEIKNLQGCSSLNCQLLKERDLTVKLKCFRDGAGVTRGSLPTMNVVIFNSYY